MKYFLDENGIIYTVYDDNSTNYHNLTANVYNFSYDVGQYVELVDSDGLVVESYDLYEDINEIVK